MNARVWFFVVAALVVALVTGACAPAATPTPIPTPTPPATPTPVPIATPIPTPTKTAEQLAYEKALEDFKAVETAAKAEGTLTIYANLEQGVMQQTLDAFTKRYPGIRIEWIYLATAQRTERVRAEAATGKHIGDLLLVSDGPARTIAKEPLFEDFVAPAVLEPRVSWLMDPKIDKDAKFAIVNASYAAMINTAKLPLGERPKSYADLRDPKWAGKIVIYEPRSGGSGANLFTALYRAYGDAFVRDIMKNAVIIGSLPEAIQSVVRGDYFINLIAPASGIGAKVAEGAPVDFWIPGEGVTPITEFNILVKGAPHPNAAKVFINWRLTKEGQGLVAATWNMPIRKDVPSTGHPVTSTDIKLMPGIPMDAETELNLTKYYDIAKQMLKELGK